MTDIASYILSSYSFIETYPLSNLIEVGNRSKDGNPIPSFDEDALIELCLGVENIFKEEHNMLEIEGNFIIVGDIHGNLHDLLRILNYIKENACKTIFLGDYIDRGSFSLECITLLFAMKIIHPNDVFLLRGNHEFDSICSKYGFKEEILKNTSFMQEDINNSHKLIDQKDIDKNNSYLLKFNKSGCYKYTEKLYKAFIQAFSYLPISALINQTTFCIHGGLCPDLVYYKLIQSKIQRPIFRFEENQLLKDVLWSDPCYDTANMFSENQRGCGYQFNFAAVNFFLNRNSLKRIVRGHQYVSRGYSNGFQNKCLTVFSASSYNHDMSNYSGILKLNQITDSIEFVNFFPIQRIYREDAFFYKVKVFHSNKDEHKPACYSFPPLNSLSSLMGTPIYNTTTKLLPNNIYKKASSHTIHLNRYPNHPNARRTNPLIKVNSLYLGKTSKSQNELDISSTNETDDSKTINHFPVMEIEMIQDEKKE